MRDVTATIVSACLAGGPCRPDGALLADAEIVAAARRGEVITVCPAVEGGLGVPRERTVLDGGDGLAVLKGTARVRTLSGQDGTHQAVLGVVKVAADARAAHVTTAILQSDSALCGVRTAPDAAGVPVGSGILAVVLNCQGVAVREVRGTLSQRCLPES